MKQKKSCIKEIITKLISCVMVSFLFFTVPVIQNKDDYIVYADENAPINPFVWLMSYFGINIYTDAVQINDAFDTAIRLAYNTYLQSLQPQQQYSIDEIIDSIEWTPSQPNVLRLSGWAFNALKGFSNWMNSVNTAEQIGEYDGYILGSFETSEVGSYLTVNANTTYEYLLQKSTSTIFYLKTGNATSEIRSAAVLYNGQQYDGFVSLDQFYIVWGAIGNTPSKITSYITIDGIRYYIYVSNFSTSNYDHLFEIPVYSGDLETDADGKRKNIIARMCFGDLVTPGDAVLNDVYALPEPAVLDDLIGAVDPESEVQLDLDGSDIAYSTALTLEDIIGMINEAVNGYVLDNSYPETIAKLIAQGVAIDDELVDVTYPEALTWQVPELIDTPQIIPLITPECPDLSSCLISGVQEVSNTMNEIININPETGGYVTAALYMGLILLILGSTVL